MTHELPEHLRAEQIALEAEIRRVFKGVSREGGMSWSEAEVVDDYGTDDERDAARALDTETSWEELVDELRWTDVSGCVCWAFLDSIGFAYYLPVALVRAVRLPNAEGSIAFHLTIPPENDTLRAYSLNQLSTLNPLQTATVARFIRFMIDAAETDIKNNINTDDELEASMNHEKWQEALDSHWNQFLEGDRR